MQGAPLVARCTGGGERGAGPPFHPQLLFLLPAGPERRGRGQQECRRILCPGRQAVPLVATAAATSQRHTRHCLWQLPESGPQQCPMQAGDNLLLEHWTCSPAGTEGRRCFACPRRTEGTPPDHSATVQDPSPQHLHPSTPRRGFPGDAASQLGRGSPRLAWQCEDWEDRVGVGRGFYMYGLCDEAPDVLTSQKHGRSGRTSPRACPSDLQRT